MEYSPQTMDEWHQKGRVKNALSNLRVIKNAYASVVCFNVACNLGHRPSLKRCARISLAANKGILTLLRKQTEGR